MKTKDGRMIMELATGKIIVDRRNVNILPWYLGGHETQQDFFQKIGMSYNKKMMNGKCKINGRGFHRWCSVADVWKYTLMMLDVYQDPAFNTMEADVAYVKPRWS